MLYLVVAFIHSQTAACIVHIIAVATTGTPFAFPFSPIHSLATRTHTPSLWLTHSHIRHLTYTHLAHRPIPERGYATFRSMATADEGELSTELEPNALSLKMQMWKYFGFPMSYVDNVCVFYKKATVFKLCRN